MINAKNTDSSLSPDRLITGVGDPPLGLAGHITAIQTTKFINDRISIKFLSRIVISETPLLPIVTITFNMKIAIKVKRNTFRSIFIFRYIPLMVANTKDIVPNRNTGSAISFKTPNVSIFFKVSKRNNNIYTPVEVKPKGIRKFEYVDLQAPNVLFVIDINLELI
jgi:hypothetical protein